MSTRSKGMLISSTLTFFPSRSSSHHVQSSSRRPLFPLSISPSPFLSGDLFQPVSLIDSSALGSGNRAIVGPSVRSARASNGGSRRRGHGRLGRHQGGDPADRLRHRGQDQAAQEPEERPSEDEDDAGGGGGRAQRRREAVHHRQLGAPVGEPAQGRHVRHLRHAR